jgi:hypothetical protein
MKLKFLLALAISICELFPASAGTEVRGGGDAVFCDSMPNLNSYSGIYSLDYFLGSLNPIGNSVPAPVDSVDASLARIADLLTTKLPALGESLSEFASLIHNHSDFSKARIWLPAQKLANLKDEDLIYGEIENCIDPATHNLKLRQAVSRVYDPDTKFIRYYFDQSIFSDLLTKGPLQLSFLLIHEWLWDLLPADRVNGSRIINWLLHSTSLETMPPDQLATSLRNLGVPGEWLSSTSPVPPSISSQSSIVVKDQYRCLAKDNILNCWGERLPAGLGLNKKFNAPIQQLSGGDQHLCAIIGSTLECWGHDDAFEGLQAFKSTTERVFANEGSTCVLTKGGELKCAGHISHRIKSSALLARDSSNLYISDYGVCVFYGAQASCLSPDGLARVNRTNYEPIHSIAMDNMHTCIASTQSLECFASNSYNRSKLHVAMSGVHRLDLSSRGTGDLVACVLVNGTPSCFGDTNEALNVPSPIINNAVDVKVSSDTACALLSDGKTQCWDL